MVGLYQTPDEWKARRVLTVLYERCKVGYDFRDGWYSIVTQESISLSVAHDLNFLAKQAADTNLKALPLATFRHIDTSDCRNIVANYPLLD